MRKLLQLTLVLAALSHALSLAATAQPNPLLPSELSGATRSDWKLVSPVELEGVAGSTAPILREFGSQRAEYAEYYSTNLPHWRIRVTVHTMPDRSAAYGAFTFFRGKGEPIQAGEACVVLRGEGPSIYDLREFLFYQGNYFVIARGAIGVHATDKWLDHLAKQLARRGPEQASLPLLPEYLPQQDLIPRTDMYILGPTALGRVAPLAPGDWVGFAYGAEVEAARYRVGTREATLLLISYPTPQMARQRLDEFSRLFNLNQSGSSPGPAAFARRKSSLVVFASGLESVEEFDQMVAGVAYEPQFSWSEPAPIDDKEIISGLLGLFLGTGLIVGLTLALGVAFGVARLLLMTTLPGRTLDKPVENDVIFLNLQNPK